MPGLREGARAFGLELTDQQLEQFGRYRELLLDWNQRVNLTAIREPEDVERLHFLDSLACLLAPIPQAARVLDVGAGAGFPGLPLKIARPDLELTPLEATGKKTRFLEAVASDLGLAGVQVINERAENLTLRESFDIVLARALAPMPVLLELTLPFCRLEGLVLAMKKGAGLPGEMASASHALTVLGGELAPGLSYELEGDKRQILAVRKARPTPAGYPRRPGVPNKRPL